MAAFEQVLKGKYPGKLHAKKVAEQIKSLGGDASGVIYLEAQKSTLIEDTDRPLHFTQRRYFFYLTGCELPDCYVAYDMSTEKSTLFIPPVDPDEVAWSGLPLTPEEALKKYDIDACLLVTDLNPFLASSSTSSSKSTVYAISTQISEATTFLGFQTTNVDLLKPAIDVCRVTKTPYEIALISKANSITHKAHEAVISSAATATSEASLHATFVATCMAHGAKEQAYSPIVAAGTAAATLHYIDNTATLKGKSLLLLDAAAELSCYASDVTRTFPLPSRPGASPTFTPEAKAIYNLVLEMQTSSLSLIHTGCTWDAIHANAHKVLIHGLQAIGIFHASASAAAILAARTSCAFFPHGLGHYLGMDTHDTGGNPDYADKDPMFRYLRVRGALPENAVVTVEPGCYFCRFIVEPYLKDDKHRAFIDESVLDKYWDVGGVRIEDNVVVKADGVENLTTVPKDVETLEKIAAGR